MFRGGFERFYDDNGKIPAVRLKTGQLEKTVSYQLAFLKLLTAYLLKLATK
jgi:hypothetical protein